MRLRGTILHIVSKISKKSTYCAKLGDSGANQDDLSIGFQKATEDDSAGIHIAFHRDDSTWEMHRAINGTVLVPM